MWAVSARYPDPTPTTTDADDRAIISVFIGDRLLARAASPGKNIYCQKENCECQGINTKIPGCKKGMHPERTHTHESENAKMYDRLEYGTDSVGQFRDIDVPEPVLPASRDFSLKADIPSLRAFETVSAPGGLPIHFEGGFRALDRELEVIPVPIFAEACASSIGQ